MTKLSKSLVKSLVWRSEVVMPNFTPKGWWENDVFRVTTSLLWTEYEIKTSASDFRADAKKVSWDGNLSKHDLLENDSSVGPSRFYFVVPFGMKVGIPKWAGRIDMKPIGNGLFSPIENKQAPLRHSRRVDKDVIHGIWRTGYWRLLRKDMEAALNLDEFYCNGSGI